MAKAVTLQTIADKVGVSKSTVSDVLRKRIGKVRVSEVVREKIFQTAEDFNYEPNAFARALVTGKTNNIGFLLSARTTLGLANDYYAALLSGVQCACKDRGYSCIASTYDLSSIKDFVMPSKVKKRKVDGIVISGYVEGEVIQTFMDHGVPFILVGDSTDFPLEGILSAGRDLVLDWLAVFEYFYELGHRYIGVGGLFSHRGVQQYNEAVEKFRQVHPDNDLRFMCYCDMERAKNDFQFAYDEAVKWSKSADRPTAVVGHDQWSIGFVSAVIDSGLRCPDDVSIVSTCDTTLCRWYRPAISTFTSSLPLYENGDAVAQLLIDYVEKKVNWVEANQIAARIWQKSELVVRSSTGPVAI